MDQDERSWKRDGTNAVRGLFMGAADVVPGVSGGTVALITGIYQRLITAISHFDLTLLGYVRRRKWKQVANHVDLRFLCTLLFGIATGFLCMTVVMHELLTHPETRSLAFAAFFGMILASGLLVVRMIQVHEKGDVVVPIVLGLIGAVFAYWLTTLKPNYDETNIPSHFYLFFCGSVAICAMILPGISGAMISLILGVYDYMLKIPGDLVHGIILQLVHCHSMLIYYYDKL